MAPVLAEDDMHSFFVGTMMMGRVNMHIIVVMGRVGRSACAWEAGYSSGTEVATGKIQIFPLMFADK